MACPEEPVAKGYKLLATQLTGKIFTDPKVDFDEDSFEKAGEYLKNNLYQLSLYQFLGWSSLKDDIKAAVQEGCKVVMIDPITALTAGVSAAETNTLLEQFSVELAAMAKDLNFHAFMFCHLKSPDGNISEDKRNKFYESGKYMDLGPIPHGMGGSVYSDQFTGSRSMMR